MAPALIQANDRRMLKCDDRDGLVGALMAFEGIVGPRLILVKCSIVRDRGIPRVSHSPTEIRDRFKNAANDPVLGN